MVRVLRGIPADDLASIYAKFVVYKAYMVFYPQGIRLRGSGPDSLASLSRTVGTGTASSGILRHVEVSRNIGTLVYTTCTAQAGLDNLVNDHHETKRIRCPHPSGQ